MKTKILKLSFSAAWPKPDNKSYRVESITNSTEYMPGEYMGKETVDMLSRKTAWQVTIVQRR